MIKNLKLKKAFSIVALVAMALTLVPVSSISAAESQVALQVVAPSNREVTEGGSISFTLNFVGNVANISLRQSAIKLEGFTANVTFSGTGNTRVVTLSNIQGTGEGKFIRIAGGIALDPMGNGSNSANSAVFTVKSADKVAPTLTISAPSKAQVYAGESVSYNLTFADNVGIVNLSLRNSAIKLEGFTADISLSGEGNNRVVTLSNIQGTVGGNKYIRVAGGIALDAMGNGSNAANSQAFTIAEKTKDTVAPVLKITGPNLGQVYAGEKVSYVLNFSDDVAVVNLDLRKSAIKLEGFTADIEISGEGLAQRIVTLSNIQGSIGGNKYIKVAGGVALDAMGNGSNAADSNPFEIVEKPSVPDTQPEPIKPSDWKENPDTGIKF